MNTSTVLAIAASAVYLVRLVPQPYKAWRTGVLSGVSPMAAINGTVSDAAWLIYGVVVALPAVWATQTIALALGLWLCAALRRTTRRGDICVGTLWALTLLIGAATGLIVAVLAFGCLVNYAPSVWAVLRTDDLRGVAVGTWLLALADAALWGTYGSVVGDPALVAYGFALTATALIVLGRVTVTRRLWPTEDADTPILWAVADGPAHNET